MERGLEGISYSSVEKVAEALGKTIKEFLVTEEG